MVAWASANFAFKLSMVSGEAPTALAAVAKAPEVAGFDAEALASPRCLLPAGSSSVFETGPTAPTELRVAGVYVSSGDGDRLLYAGGAGSGVSCCSDS